MGLFSIVIIVGFKQGGDRVVVLRGWGGEGGGKGEGEGEERAGGRGGWWGGALRLCRAAALAWWPLVLPVFLLIISFFSPSGFFVANSSRAGLSPSAYFTQPLEIGLWGPDRPSRTLSVEEISG